MLRLLIHSMQITNKTFIGTATKALKEKKKTYFCSIWNHAKFQKLKPKNWTKKASHLTCN